MSPEQQTWLLISLISLFFSAIFSGVEIAFVTSDRVRLEIDVKKGGLVSRLLNIFYADSDFFISTILVGNNIVLVVYGIGAAKLIEPLLADIVGNNEFLILLLQTLISTGIILITGEFLPKTIFRINPNRSLRLMALPLFVIYLILYPISLLATGLSKGIMKLLGMPDAQPRPALLSIGDLNQYLERTIDDNAETKTEIENEVKIFHNALDFSTTHLRDCMTPRNEIVAVNMDTTREELSELFTRSGRSKIIVYKDDIDDVRGYIHVSELFDPAADWHQHLKPVLFAPETLLADKMMRRLLSEKRSMAIVVDEFGGTAGMVTLEDLVEEIFGDIQDEHDKQGVTAREVMPGVYEMSGRTEIEYINDTFHLGLPEDDEYQTLAGYLLNSTGAIPSEGEIIQLPPLTFEIVKKKGVRLELIRCKANP